MVLPQYSKLHIWLILYATGQCWSRTPRIWFLRSNLRRWPALKVAIYDFTLENALCREVGELCSQDTITDWAEVWRTSKTSTSAYPRETLQIETGSCQRYLAENCNWINLPRSPPSNATLINTARYAGESKEREKKWVWHPGAPLISM